MTEKLKPCPCGKTPKDLNIDNDSDFNFYLVSGDCCNGWFVMFTPIGYTKKDEYESAVNAWNEAQRKGEKSK